MIVRVESIAGPIGIPEPQVFMLGNRRVQVDAILDRWISSAHSYFKLTANEGEVYILRHDEESGEWEMSLFQAPLQ